MRTIERKPLHESEIEMMNAISKHLEIAANAFLANPDDIETQEYFARAGYAYDAVSESGTDWSELARLARAVRLYGASDVEKIHNALTDVLHLDY